MKRQLCITRPWLWASVLALGLFFAISIDDLQAYTTETQNFKLSYLPPTKAGEACDAHSDQSREKSANARKSGGRPATSLESEHRPLSKRAYAIRGVDRRALLEAYIRRPDGSVTIPQLRQGYNPMVTFTTPLNDLTLHGPNSVYVVEKGVEENVMHIRTAKWITMHHSCRWGHDHKFDTKYTVPQSLDSIPVEIVVDKLWDTNFHLAVFSGDTLAITVISFGQPVPGAEVTVTSAKGWTIKGTTGDDGKVAVQMIRDYYPPSWKLFKRSHRGEFLISASYSSSETGSFHEKPYDTIHYSTTLPWQYSSSLRDYGSYSHGLLLAVIGMSVSGLGVFFYRERRKKSYRKIHFNE